MAYFETTIISKNNRIDFDIVLNKELYDYLTCHSNSNVHGEDWFDITLNQDDVENIQNLCKSDDEKELIGKNICDGSIIDILIHRGFIVSNN